MSLYSAPSEISGGTGHIFEMGTPPPYLPSKWVSHNGVLETPVACPKIENMGQNVRGTTGVQELDLGEALICQTFGIRGVTGENMKFETRGHSILATRMAGNSAKIGTLSETLGISDENPTVLEQLVDGAYWGYLEMEVQDPPP